MILDRGMVYTEIGTTRAWSRVGANEWPIWEYLRGITLYGPLIAEADRFAHLQRFFHWPVEFPDILGRADLMSFVGNPPWERVKLQEEEFFAARAPEISNAKNAAARKRLIAALSRPPHLATEWNTAVRTAACESAFLRLSGRTR